MAAPTTSLGLLRRLPNALSCMNLGKRKFQRELWPNSESERSLWNILQNYSFYKYQKLETQHVDEFGKEGRRTNPNIRLIESWKSWVWYRYLAKSMRWDLVIWTRYLSKTLKTPAPLNMPTPTLAAALRQGPGTRTRFRKQCQLEFAMLPKHTFVNQRSQGTSLVRNKYFGKCRQRIWCQIGK